MVEVSDVELLIHTAEHLVSRLDCPLAAIRILIRLHVQGVICCWVLLLERLMLYQTNGVHVIIWI